MLTEEFTPYLIANLRRSCALGKVPADVAEGRRLGAAFEPDPGDQCVTALVRTARDGHLPDFYRELLTGLGGRAEDAAQWPGQVGAKLLAGAAQAPIGNGKAVTVTPAIALDAGFAAAYQAGGAGSAVKADSAQLKTVAEACLDQKQDAATCYSVGYVYGGQALQGWTAAAR